MIDLFLEAGLGSVDKQSTDTHFRAENGVGSFNWRMKFDITLPPRGECLSLHKREHYRLAELLVSLLNRARL